VWHSLTNRLLGPRFMEASEWWRMPLIGLVISGPISLTTSLFLATYGAEGPYGGFWRLLFAGLAASVPIFVLSGLFFAPLEIWLTRRPQRLPGHRTALLRSGTLAVAGVFGAFLGYFVVVWALPAPPPDPLLPVMLVTYPLNTAIVGLAYTLYDEYVYQLRFTTQLTQEMRVARGIQQGLFPRQYPHIPSFELAAQCQPARETGGDFFDFIELQDGRVGLIIGDVAGKGMPAALLMANIRSTWRAEARLACGPGEALRRANRSLCRDINSNSFVTCLYAVLDPESRQLCCASAGHPLPLWRRGSQVSEVEVYGLPLGLEPEATYEEVAVTLLPEDTVLLYTDGVTEAINPNRELFGFERLAALLERQGDRPAGALLNLAWSQAQAFGAEVGQTDDVTLIVLKAHKVATPSSSRPAEPETR
jgi:serine phosphatase RsbU (regulator of sigma subunit)